jgi:hypothetical protein
LKSSYCKYIFSLTPVLDLVGFVVAVAGNDLAGASTLIGVFEGAGAFVGGVAITFFGYTISVKLQSIEQL